MESVPFLNLPTKPVTALALLIQDRAQPSIS